MLEWCLLACFVVCCALLMKDGLAKPARVFQYPFLAGVGLSSFLLLQAIGVVWAGDIAPSAGVSKALFMSSLCCVAVYWGWRSPVRSARRADGEGPTSYLYWYLLGVAMLAVGFLGMIKLGSLSGGVVAYYSVGGGYALEWRGLPVIDEFFVSYLQPGIILCTLAGLRLRSRMRLLPVLGAFLFVLADIVLMGRRTMLAFLLITVGLMAYFHRRWTPPRSAVIAAACLGCLALFVFPYYRAYSQLGGDWGAIKAIDPSDIVRGVLQNQDAEFSTAAYLIQVTEEEGIFQYGIGFYNSFVRYFVPKVLVGEEGKARLLIDLPDAGHVGPVAGSVPNRYAWTTAPNTVPTGPASVFQQFWYLGCVCFYFVARWMKRHWVRAVTGDLLSQAVYAVSATYAVVAVVNDVYAIYIPVFMFIFPLTVVTRLRVWLHGSARP